MKSTFIPTVVAFGDGNQFQTVVDVTTSGKGVQRALFGRDFPMRGTTDQMLTRIDEQLQHMETWKGNLESLKKQVIIEDFERNQTIYRQYLGKEL